MFYRAARPATSQGQTLLGLGQLECWAYQQLDRDGEKMEHLEFEVISAIMLDDSPYVLHEQSTQLDRDGEQVGAPGVYNLVGGPHGGTKEMTNPCLIYLHVISLGAQEQVEHLGRLDWCGGLPAGVDPDAADEPSRAGQVGHRGVEQREQPTAVDLCHWRDCHFADALSPSLLIHLLKGEGGAAE